MRIYSQDIKDKIRLMRLAGLSLGQIQKKINIPKTTIHLWVSKIDISFEQREAIRQNALKALQEGRVRAQSIQKEKTKLKEKEFVKKGVNKVGKLSHKELFIAGIALYWGEGFKNIHERRLGFCNSDPNMLRFYVYWLEKCIGTSRKDLVARLTLNRTYKEKTKEIEKYWSDIIGIPLNQFTKPFYQNSLWKKQFNTSNYHGVLRIHVKNSLERLLEMRGWLEGLKLNLPG
ncbi:hypothetical protein KJ980_08130 [Patescibacteria group bacterium]|nr:hypothetical protein [Patescibacteria group bacterium]MBU4016298.1 hypothetical protein [Patescibacteria group bacterium]MBU4099585.1 hypothetical protein [Patescibacteria group bacterium]